MGSSRHLGISMETCQTGVSVLVVLDIGWLLDVVQSGVCGNGLLLERDQFFDSFSAEIDQLCEFTMVKRAFFTSALKLDVFILVSHDKIHIHFGIDVFFVVEVQ